MHADLKWLAENELEWAMDDSRLWIIKINNEAKYLSLNSLDKENYYGGALAFPKVKWQAARDEFLIQRVHQRQSPSLTTQVTAWHPEQDSQARVHSDACNEDPFSSPEEDEAWDEAEHRMNAIARNGNDGDAYPQARQLRYQDDEGGDWIDEAARTLTPQEFRGAMRFTIGKYNRSMGKKDDLISEIEKIRDYATRWLEVEQGR
jgi:hypothetical protein